MCLSFGVCFYASVSVLVSHHRGLGLIAKNWSQDRVIFCTSKKKNRKTLSVFSILN